MITIGGNVLMCLIFAPSHCVLYLHCLLKSSLFHTVIIMAKTMTALCIIFCSVKKKLKKMYLAVRFWFAQTAVLESDLLNVKGMVASILRFGIPPTGAFQE